MTDLHQLFYVSASRTDAADLSDLVTQARSRNAAADVSGLLVYSGGAFAQLLEGPEAALQRLLEHLRADVRHTALRVLAQGPCKQRRCEGWSMRLLRTEAADDLLQHLLTDERAPARAQHLIALLLRTADAVE